MTAEADETGFRVELEYASAELAEVIFGAMQVRGEAAPIVRMLTRIAAALRPGDLQRTRVIFSGDFVQSVNDRGGGNGAAFTLERGAGVVGAKTLPPDEDGIVDIVIPAYAVVPMEDEQAEAARDRLNAHTAAHEVVHATLHHLGAELFATYRREQLGYATRTFVALAGEQAEEHLAEHLANRAVGSPGGTGTTVSSLKASFHAWMDGLPAQLAAIPAHDPDEYFTRGVQVTFTSLHILWKALAYLAAELREADHFQEPPDDIRALAEWQAFVLPWWDDYTRLLGAIPMTVDVAAVDVAVRELGDYLQWWALGLGYDFHDTPDGGWFRIRPGAEAPSVGAPSRRARGSSTGDRDRAIASELRMITARRAQELRSGVRRFADDRVPRTLKEVPV